MISKLQELSSEGHGDKEVVGVGEEGNIMQLSHPSTGVYSTQSLMNLPCETKEEALMTFPDDYDEDDIQEAVIFLIED